MVSPNVIVIAVIMAGLLVFGCSREPESPMESIVIHDSSQNELLKKLLRKKGIHFKVDDRGWIWYSLKDRDVVSQAAKEIRRERRETGVWFGGDSEKQRTFLEELERQGISYSIRSVDGKSWVVWSLADDEKVNKLIDRMKLFPKAQPDEQPGTAHSFQMRKS